VFAEALNRFDDIFVLPQPSQSMKKKHPRFAVARMRFNFRHVHSERAEFYNPPPVFT
jgi:hypothetical protein